MPVTEKGAEVTEPVDNPAGNDTTGSTVPNPETGAGIGASSEPNTMEPEEDPDAVDDPNVGNPSVS